MKLKIKTKRKKSRYKKNTLKNKKAGASITDDKEEDLIIETFIPFDMSNYQFNSKDVSIHELINGLILLRLVNSKSRVQLNELCLSIEDLDISQINIMEETFPNTMKQKDIQTWNRLGQNEWPFYYGMYIETPNTLFILLRGTRNELSIDWEYNIDYTLVEFLGGYVHKGFLDIFLNYIQPHLDIILNYGNIDSPNLIICGYSLGSALAYLTSFYIAKNYPEIFTKVRILLYSLPPIGDISFNNLYQLSSLYALNTINVIFNNDPLPKVGYSAKVFAYLHIPQNISVVIPDETNFPWIRKFFKPKEIADYHKIKYFLPILKTLQQQSIELEMSTNGDIFDLYQLPNYPVFLEEISHNQILYLPILTYEGLQTIYFLKNTNNQVVLFIDNKKVIINNIEIISDHNVKLFNPLYLDEIMELNREYTEAQLTQYQITFMIESNQGYYILKFSRSHMNIILHLISILHYQDKSFELPTVDLHNTAIIYHQESNHIETTKLPVLNLNPDLDLSIISLQQYLMLKPSSITKDEEFVVLESLTLEEYLETDSLNEINHLPENLFVIIVDYRMAEGRLHYLRHNSTLGNHYLEINTIYMDFKNSHIIINHDMIIEQDKPDLEQFCISLIELLMKDLVFHNPLYNCNLILNSNETGGLINTYIPIYFDVNIKIGFTDDNILYLVEYNKQKLVTLEILQTYGIPNLIIEILIKHFKL